MRKICGVLICSASLALAGSYSGALVDASCYDRQNQQPKDVQKAADSCAATSQTTMFAVHSAGKVLKLDANGNSKAVTALKNRADRSEPGKPAGSITAKIEGTETAGTIKVDSLEVQ